MAKKTEKENDLTVFSKIFPTKLSRGDLRKMDIIRATIACLAEDGFENTNFESVGKRAHIQRAHVAYHFKTKEQLVESAIKYILAQGQETVLDYMTHAASSQSPLDAYIEGTFRWLNPGTGYGPSLLLLGYLSSVYPSFRVLSNEFKRIGTERVKTLLPGIASMDKKRSEVVSERVHTWILGRCLYFLTCDIGAPVNDFIKSTQNGARLLIERESRK